MNAQDSLRIENKASRRCGWLLFLIPLVPLIITAISLTVVFTMRLSGRLPTPLDFNEFISVLGFMVYSVVLETAIFWVPVWVGFVLLGKSLVVLNFGPALTSRDLGATRRIEKVVVWHDQGMKYCADKVYLVAKLMPDATLASRIGFLLWHRILKFPSRLGWKYFDFATFHDKGNAEKVAQAIADFADVSIEHQFPDVR